MGVKDNLKKGTVEILVLSVLNKEDMYGYQITQTIAELSGGLFKVLEGSLYPILYRLTKEGYLSEYTEMVKRRVRVYYHMEDSGRAYLDECLKAYKVVNLGIERVIGDELKRVGD